MWGDHIEGRPTTIEGGWCLALGGCVHHQGSDRRADENQS